MKQKNRVVNTEYGIATYYTMDNVYKDKLTFFLRFNRDPPLSSEREFSVVKKEYSIEEMEEFIQLYANGFNIGRNQGRWEKATRINELFSLLRTEGVNI